MRIVSIALIFSVIFPAAVWAQDSDDVRLELARKMNDIKPAREQIFVAIETLATSYPPEKQEEFVNGMFNHMDIGAVEQKSIQIMAELFTADELRKMIDYFGSEEGKSVSEKMPVYQELVRPTLIGELDKAMMEVKTGNANTP